MKNLILGFVFAMLWATASVASKYGIQVSQPLVFSNVRFLSAGVILLLLAKILGKDLRISRQMLIQCTIYGFLNVTLYLGAFIFGIKHVSAGIGSLATSINPLFISVLSVFFLGTTIQAKSWWALLLGMFGVVLATYPLLQTAYADIWGLFFLTISMLSYSLGTIYYLKKQWPIDPLVLNGWQVFFGGILLLPLTLFLYDNSANNFNLQFAGSVGWLIFLVSIFAVQIWLYLLKIDPQRTSLWLFLCPIFGFVYAAIILNEPISNYTILGTVIVLLALVLGQWEKIRSIFKA